ncbi:MAG: hypothetical protein M1533_02380 [Candidatus Thermoplasmatota archaeon]|jgi:hypothetical protein|nr:hypothetical protein [Candidatus Thermoplasmatota archaeon]MCL5794297.1 hypothetical protein [Candidatus Thermoplasmatota archaeon]
MRKIKLSRAIESTYKVKAIVILGFLLTFLLSGSYYFTQYNYSNYLDVIANYFTKSVTLDFYGVIIGLLLTAYTVLIGFIPNFTGDSLKMPIFGQINRLFLFTILDAMLLMILDFTQGMLSESLVTFAGTYSFAGFPIFLDAIVFFFISMMIGLIFCVLTLSEIFTLLRTKGELRHSRDIDLEAKRRYKNGGE